MAQDETGVLYASYSLLNILLTNHNLIPFGTINDYADFQMRLSHLDCGRKYFNVN
jgi:N-acetyl-beta-hexosaminidase